LVGDKESRWPKDGEIDIVEGVNNNNRTKVALHTSRGCDMNEINPSTFDAGMTGEFDTAFGVPNKNTGEPSRLVEYAKDCYVYDELQWANQGCVVVSEKDGSIGSAFNENGGGVYVLEFNPLPDDGGGFIKSWVFRHGIDKFPPNLEEVSLLHLN